MTKIHKLHISQYDLSHTEFKLESIHTSHSYIIPYLISVIQNSKGVIGRATERKLQKRVLPVARQFLLQAIPINMFPRTHDN